MNPSPKKTTVLLIDDEAYVRNFVGRLLKKVAAVEIMEARNGREGVELFQAHQPDLVMLDINMPNMNGLQTLQALRLLSATAPIIMLTSISEESVVEECVGLGASFFIRKDMPPADLPGALCAALREFVDLKEPNS